MCYKIINTYTHIYVHISLLNYVLTNSVVIRVWKIMGKRQSIIHFG